MKLHLQSADGVNVIHHYGQGKIAVNAEIYTRALIVLPQRIVPDWEPQRVEDLTCAHFEQIARLAPEIVLLGTGTRLRFPKPALSAALAERQIALEVMDTGAACRTYNILMGEGRQVAAALLIPE